RLDCGKCRARLVEPFGVEHVCRELARTRATMVRREASRSGGALPPLCSLGSDPRVLQDCGTHRRGEIETRAGTIVLVEASEDPERLGVALKAFLKAEAITRETVESLLTKVPERGVPQIMG